MLAFLLSLLSAFTLASLLAQWGALGSCFEGSCGYLAGFIVTPVLTLLSFPLWRRWASRWGPVSRILGWAPVVLILAALVTRSDMVFFVVMACIGVLIFLAARRQRSKGKPLRELFLKEKPGEQGKQ